MLQLCGDGEVTFARARTGKRQLEKEWRQVRETMGILRTFAQPLRDQIAELKQGLANGKEADATPGDGTKAEESIVHL